ncbi:hypothetical protein BOX15_Mlig000528g5 [Macrostomum lignano]|uniref:Thioredoxin-like fold domain-containing protein n=1 Tax=Macrostomum lignano TaxID=282301 RepID=A0A267DS32_9PLAT|nr:hypothetical protein BOX15_Mlig000528g5 [Macrostomum lignano]
MGNLTSSSGPRIPNYKPGKVYLFTFPSVRCCPTISPFALKVESWLRLNGIEYEAIRSYSHWSKKGQVPFVEVDGREINESSFIIKELAAKFNKLDDLTAEQQAVSSMVEAMVDNHLVWSYSHYRMLVRKLPSSSRCGREWRGEARHRVPDNSAQLQIPAGGPRDRPEHSRGDSRHGLRRHPGSVWPAR